MVEILCIRNYSDATPRKCKIFEFEKKNMAMRFAFQSLPYAENLSPLGPAYIATMQNRFLNLDIFSISVLLDPLFATEFGVSNRF